MISMPDDFLPQVLVTSKTEKDGKKFEMSFVLTPELKNSIGPPVTAALESLRYALWQSLNNT